MQYLSLDINWSSYQPEQQEEFLRTLDDLIKEGYHTLSPQEKKDISLSGIENVSHTDFKKWDLILSRVEDLQAGDWKNMTPEEKKAAYYLAWGPAEDDNKGFRQKLWLRVLLLGGAAVATYYSFFAYCRCI